MRSALLPARPALPQWAPTAPAHALTCWSGTEWQCLSTSSVSNKRQALTVGNMASAGKLHCFCSTAQTAQSKAGMPSHSKLTHKLQQPRAATASPRQGPAAWHATPGALQPPDPARVPTHAAAGQPASPQPQGWLAAWLHCGLAAPGRHCGPGRQHLAACLPSHRAAKSEAGLQQPRLELLGRKYSRSEHEFTRSKHAKLW